MLVQLFIFEIKALDDQLLKMYNPNENGGNLYG